MPLSRTRQHTSLSAPDNNQGRRAPEIYEDDGPLFHEVPVVDVVLASLARDWTQAISIGSSSLLCTSRDAHQY